MDQNDQALVFSNNPWDQRGEIGLWQAFWQTVQFVLFKPGDFFGQLEVKKGYGASYSFCIFCNTLSWVAATVFNILIFKTLFHQNANYDVPSVFINIIFIFAGPFFAAAIMHLFVMMFRGQGGYKGTFDILAYGSAASIFTIIPIAGVIVGWFWAVVIAVKGYCHIHHFSRGRAVLAYSSPLILVVFVTLAAAIAIPNLLRARIRANDSLAKSNLLRMAAITENYAKTNYGSYPGDLAAITNADPSFAQNYCGKTEKGYTFNCQFSREGYSFTAVPVIIGQSGSRTYTVVTGGVLTPQE